MEVAGALSKVRVGHADELLSNTRAKITSAIQLINLLTILKKYLLGFNSKFYNEFLCVFKW